MPAGDRTQLRALTYALFIAIAALAWLFNDYRDIAAERKAEAEQTQRLCAAVNRTYPTIHLTRPNPDRPDAADHPYFALQTALRDVCPSP